MRWQNAGDKFQHIPGGMGYRQRGPRGGAALQWYDPAGEGLSCVAAYRAVNSVGSVWPGGPTTYAASKVNLVTPGTYDLAESNGAVSWSEAGGWAFTAALSQTLYTNGLTNSTHTWTVYIQFNTFVQGWYIMSSSDDGLGTTFDMTPAYGVARERYAQRASIYWAAPNRVSGNMAMAGMNCYFNGAFIVALTAVTFTNTKAHHLGGTSAPAGFSTFKGYAMAIYNEIHGAGTVGNVAAAMAQL